MSSIANSGKSINKNIIASGIKQTAPIKHNGTAPIVLRIFSQIFFI